MAPATETLTFPTADPYTVEAERFAAAILDGLPTPTPPEDAVANLRVIERIFAAGNARGARDARGVTGARLADVPLPDFGMPDAEPLIPAEVYAARLDRLREAMDRRGYDRLVVYADREHSANLAWLTGFDPRFEEAIAVVGPTEQPAILVGNECFGTAGAAPLPMRRILFQDLSLPGQPRDRSRPLAEILGDEGIGAGRRVGVVGWKTYADRGSMETPAFLVDELRRLTGPGGLVENATDLLIDAGSGLRVIERGRAAGRARVRRLPDVQRRPARADRAAAGDDRARGGAPARLERDAAVVPHDADRRAAGAFGLLSPGDRPIERGDPFTVAFGMWGALDCRAGFVVEDATELPPAIGDYVERLVAPYFEAVAAWYGALRIGETGGALYDAVMRRSSATRSSGSSSTPGT